jgi:autotransporter-associated beta strand protein
MIRGDSDSGIAVDGARSGFTVTINNNAGATIKGGGVASAAVRTGLDDDTINNAGVIDGSSSGKAIDLGAGNNTLKISGGAASVNGNIDGGVGGHNTMTMELGAGNSFVYAGAIAHFDSVELKSGNATLSGHNTYAGDTIVSGGILTLDGSNRVAANSALVLNGGALHIANVSAANGETFASLSLLNNSSIDLASSSITFNGLGTIGGGSILTVLGYSNATSPSYAFRLLGNDTSNAAFLTLMSHTTINGLATTFSFDGTYTNVAAVPLPAAFTMMFSSLGLLAAVGRRAKRRSSF